MDSGDVLGCYLRLNESGSCINTLYYITLHMLCYTLLIGEGNVTKLHIIHLTVAKPLYIRTSIFYLSISFFFISSAKRKINVLINASGAYRRNRNYPSSLKKPLAG